MITEGDKSKCCSARVYKAQSRIAHMRTWHCSKCGFIVLVGRKGLNENDSPSLQGREKEETMTNKTEIGFIPEKTGIKDGTRIIKSMKLLEISKQAIKI